MNANIKTCDDCQFYTTNSAGGVCHANPPIIVEALIDQKVDAEFAIFYASWRPHVDFSDPACRFFVEGGAS